VKLPKEKMKSLLTSLLRYSIMLSLLSFILSVPIAVYLAFTNFSEYRLVVLIIAVIGIVFPLTTLLIVIMILSTIKKNKAIVKELK
jgi:ABC-type amino acid transport system permease subunit